MNDQAGNSIPMEAYEYKDASELKTGDIFATVSYRFDQHGRASLKLVVVSTFKEGGQKMRIKYRLHGVEAEKILDTFERVMVYND